jgi:uncharacterized membrane protein YgcG
MVEVLADGSERPVDTDFQLHSIVTDGYQAKWSYVAEDETRTWRFRYRVACAVRAYEDTAHLYWQFVGVGWDKPTDHVVATVHLPGRFSGDLERPVACDPDTDDPLPMAELDPTPLGRGEVRAFGHGPLNGEVSFVDPQTIRYEAWDVPALSYVEGSILFPTDVVPLAAPTAGEQLEAALERERRWSEEANAVRSRHETERGWAIGLLIGVPVALAALVAVARVRDRVPRVPPILEQPPGDDPVGAALLWSAWRGFLSPQNAYRAQLLRLARLGAIELRAEGRVSDPKELTIVRRMDALDLPTEADQDFMWLLFGRGSDSVDEVAVGRTRPLRRGGYDRYTKWLEATKQRSAGLIRRIQKGDARLESTGAAVVAMAGAGYGVWTAAWGLGGPIGWWLVPVSAMALIVTLRIVPARLALPDRTRVMRLAAFRRYLRDFSDLPNAPALAVIVWEHYLEWAVALDVARRVERQVRTLVPAESLRSPLPGGPAGLAGINAWHSFQAAAPTIVLHSMASASRSGSTSGGFGGVSSSSGFGGGGFSGGGGGGGGGTGGGAG